MKLEIIQGKIKKNNPKIHSITNTITSNDCANLILATGGSATMASDPAEAAEMTSHSDALVLNLGAVSSLDAMILAGKRANEQAHPIVLDPVAAGATKLRQNACKTLMQQLSLTAIRGNAAEIHTLAALSQEIATGQKNPDSISILSLVDVEKTQSMQKSRMDACLSDAKQLSSNTGAIVVVSGIDDLVVSQEQYVLLEGGSVLSSHITGSGCMLTELIAVCLTTALPHTDISPLDAVCCAVQWMNNAAEEADALTKTSNGGTMTYRMHLIDCISQPLMRSLTLKEEPASKTPIPPSKRNTTI